MKRLLLISIFIFAVSTQSIASECIPTPHRTTGTHYKPVTEQKTHVSKGVIFKDQVLAYDCNPVANAKVAHWQADEQGRYVNRLRAYLFTDKNGRFQFETEWPNLNPPHIHFIVTANGHEILETQWVGNERQSEIDFRMVVE